MNSISKVNNFNFLRILVRRTILNWRITPESTTHIYRIKGEGGSGWLGAPPPPPPTGNVQTVNFAPANYISLEREFNSE